MLKHIMIFWGIMMNNLAHNDHHHYQFIDVFVVYVTHSFELIGVIEEAQDDIGDSDKDDDTNEEEVLMHIYFN